MQLQFKTDHKVKGYLSINNLNHYLKIPSDVDIDTSDDSATIEFTLELYIKGWGIDSISFMPKRLSHSFTWTVTPDDIQSAEERQAVIAAGGVEMRNNTFEGTIDIDTDKDQWEWITGDLQVKADGGFQITDIEFDFKDKTITLQ